MVLLALLTAGAVQSQALWFTIEGDVKLPAADIVEVDTLSLSRDGENRSMMVRASRADLRSSWDGVPYRSYTAQVMFDCAEKTARYKWLAFYMRPLWEGEVHKTSVYSADDVRPMRFVDLQPNPTQRIINAACRTPLDKDEPSGAKKQ